MGMRESIVRSRKPEFAKLQQELKAIGDWYIFYTHPYDATDKDKNILVWPNDVPDVDFYGMIIDLVHDYTKGKGLSIKGNIGIHCLAKVLENAYEGKIDLREKP